MKHLKEDLRTIMSLSTKQGNGYIAEETTEGTEDTSTYFGKELTETYLTINLTAYVDIQYRKTATLRALRIRIHLF